MARTVNYPKRAEKIKEMIDDLVKEMGHSPHRMSKKDKIKLIDIDFENIDVVTLMQVQARVSFHAHLSFIYGSCIHPTALWLEMGNSGLCDCLVCRMEPDVCQKARLVGRCGGSRSRSRKRLHFYPSVCHEA